MYIYENNLHAFDDYQRAENQGQVTLHVGASTTNIIKYIYYFFIVLVIE